MEISHIFTSNVLSGVTSLQFVTVNQTFTKGHTLLAFISCHDIGLTPHVPVDWNLVSQIDGVSGSTFVYLNQPTGTTINPTYTISGLSNQLNIGSFMVLSGCSYHSSDVINASATRDNSGTTSTGTNGFLVLKNRSMIIQFITIFKNISINGYVSTPSLTWTEQRNNSLTYGSYTMRMALATSSQSNTVKYSDISYSLTPTPDTENIAIDISLTPRRSNVNMSMSSL